MEERDSGSSRSRKAGFRGKKARADQPPTTMPTAFFSFSTKILTRIRTMEGSKNAARDVGVMRTGLLKAIAQPAIGLTLRASGTLAFPSSAIAQFTVGGFKSNRTSWSAVGQTCLKLERTDLRQDVPINSAREVDAPNNAFHCENEIIGVRHSGATRMTDALRLLLNPAASVLPCFRY